MDIHVTRMDKVKEVDILKMKEAKKMLLPCPVCGSKAFISKDVVDGYYFGWSVGCPRFSLRDRIHGITEHDPQEKHLSFFGLDSAKECVEKWNEKVKRYGK